MTFAASLSDRPLVTMAVFAFNQQEHIGEALEGALSQTYEPLEIQIFDDYSSDETLAVVEMAMTAYTGPHKVSVHRNSENLGWSRFGQHFNSVVTQARGELIILAAGDDISRPNRAEKLVNAWINAGRPPCVLHSAYETLSETPRLHGQLRCEGRGFGDRTPLEMAVNDGEGILGATIAFTPDLLTKFGPLPEATVFEDRALGFRAILVGQVIYLNEPLIQYRLHSANVSGPNIYSDPARWRRFCRGHRTLYESFRTDYLAIYPDNGHDARVLLEIERRTTQLRRREKLLTGTFLQKILAAWSVTIGQRNWLYRILFLLRAVGLRRSKGAKK